MVTAADILATVEEQRVRFVALWFTDITGLVKSVMIPASELENVVENGSHFDGSAIEGFARVAESDMILVPDLSSFVILPWTAGEDKTARLICSICTQNGDPFIGDPRSLLIKALDQAQNMNLRFKTGMELEFFLFPSIPPGSRWSARTTIPPAISISRTTRFAQCAAACWQR